MRTKIFLIVMASTAFMITGCITKPVTVMVNDTGNETVKARAGKSISIKLRSQLSTGYSWKIMEMPETVTLVKENVISDEKTLGLTGGYELQEFIFKTSKTGGTLIFKYGEHWKKKPEYVNTAKVIIQVE